MTKTISIESVKDSIQAVIALTENGDEVVVEEKGKPRIKIVPITEPASSKRIAGLGKGYWMSEDFDDELPDEFWGFDKEL